MLETVFARHSHGRLGAFDLKNGTEGRSVCPETDGNARTHVHARTHTCMHARTRDVLVFSTRLGLFFACVSDKAHAQSGTHVYL